ncbi:anosmin-1-like [Rhopilema esculentum]|uniref:anosmin-1-like n=1 Tax=Rhopilema esculentum TaxID=499914 RepID=UPI0031E3A073
MDNQFLFFVPLIFAVVVKGYERNTLMRTYCRASCIEKHEIPSSKIFPAKKKFKPVLCLSEGCAKCTSFCHLDTRAPCSSQCNSTKSENEICLDRCEFLKVAAKKGKPGKCPDTRKGFELAKVGRCTGDFDCLGPEKCCRNGDVQTCQSPEFIFNSSFPPVPIDVKARKKSSSSLLLSWGLPQNSTWVGVIVFVIEFRHASRVLRPTNNDFSFWSFAGQTSSLQKTIKSLVPGEWYQLRVIAYSLNGTNGYSQPSAGFRLDVEVRRPSPPRNFKASNAWFQNKKIFVNVTWTPPLFPDLPVRRYRIIYNKHVDGSMYHYDAIPLRRTKISGKETSTILKNLDPSSIYVVKIQAMLSLRRKKIKGQWGTMYLKTPPLQSREPLTTRGTLSNTGFSEIVNSSVSIKCTQVIHTPNGFSKIILQWSVPVAVEGIQFEYEPEKCKNEEKKLKSKVTVSAKDDSLTIEDLYQNCNYFVKMTAFYSNRSTAFQRSIYFSTYPIVTTMTISTTSEPKKRGNSGSRLEATFYFYQYFISVFLVSILNLTNLDL